MDNLSAKQYKGRRYAPGSSDADSITVGIRDDQFHVIDSNGVESVLPMTAVSLKLGGSSSDRVVLEIQKTGDTIIVNDLEFLKVLKQAQATSAITRQVSRAETARTFDKLRGFAFVGVILFVIFLFGGCIYVAAILEPDRASHEQQEDGSTASEESSGETTTAASQQQQQVTGESAEAKQNREYEAKVKKILLAAWATPPKEDYSTVIVQMDLAKDGTVKKIELMQPSGNTLTDLAAIKAVKKSSPLPAPPSFWTEPIRLMFTFNPLDKQAN